jgi:hypothetical protein
MTAWGAEQNSSMRMTGDEDGVGEEVTATVMARGGGEKFQQPFRVIV